ncbi:Zinc finger protein [Lachnellula subtilissima]|uniref:Zinc finger protein n=1 Tax=Lachnellula subtilissima TaxID=602034 RepID=A0A8H8U574_9HELO|nr:Zinc finger protein [Lachnellula subtilissima]
MSHCRTCDRWFNTYNGYLQHVNNSPAHQSSSKSDWECDACDRSFATENSLHQHCSSAGGHPYCIPCKRMFISEHNLMQHMHSKIHSSMACPFCKSPFANASGVIIHLEAGRCPSGFDRHRINEAIRKLDRNNVITKPMIELPGYGGRVETIATDMAWNGSGFECYLCRREFGSLYGLNNHLKSPAHDQEIYRCPKAGCGRNYKLLSALVQHVESESCGLMRFSQVQKQARHGIDNMVGRMITG